MINYSIYPPEVVFADYDDFEANFEEITLNSNIKLLVERIDKKSVKIAQIISSDPQSYLREEIQPGTILETNLQFS
ncbi:MAG: YlzJ-like family protein [Halanaerobiales bacterium]